MVIQKIGINGKNTLTFRWGHATKVECLWKILQIVKRDFFEGNQLPHNLGSGALLAAECHAEEDALEKEQICPA